MSTFIKLICLSLVYLYFDFAYVSFKKIRKKLSGRPMSDYIFQNILNLSLTFILYLLQQPGFKAIYFNFHQATNITFETIL